MASRRPGGTDGSDFEFRMVVADRYKKAAAGRQQFQSIIRLQLVLSFLVAVSVAHAVLLAQAAALDAPTILQVTGALLGPVAAWVGGLAGKSGKAPLLRLYSVITVAVTAFTSWKLSTLVSSKDLPLNWPPEGDWTNSTTIVFLLTMVLSIITQLTGIWTSLWLASLARSSRKQE